MKLRTLFGFLPPKLLYSTEELPLDALPLPERSIVLVPLEKAGQSGLALKTGDNLKTGERIMSASGQVAAISPVTGPVQGIYSMNWLNGERYFAVEVLTSSEDIYDTSVVGIDYASKDRGALFTILSEAGLCFGLPGDGADIAVINCMENDLYLSNRPHVLRENKDLVSQGIGLLKHLLGAGDVVFAVPASLVDIASEIAGTEASLSCVPHVYPSGLADLLKDRFSDIGSSASVIDVENLCSMVKYLKDGRPLFDKIITVTGRGGVPLKSLKVRAGTPVIEILKYFNIVLEKDDRLVLGGPMRGKSVYHTDFPVMMDTCGVLVQGGSEIIGLSGDACLNCGKCVRACPYSLQANLLSRYAEYSLFERCVDYEIECCIECGMCSYVCSSRRPVLQFIQFAKIELEKLEKEEGR